MITHYVPQFLLERFKSQGLLELDLESGTIIPRAVLKAGSGKDIWPADIEHEIMGPYDDIASKILRNVWDVSTVRLTTLERYDFACWLTLFLPRVPNVHEVFKEMMKAAHTNPEIAVQGMYLYREDSLKTLKALEPQMAKWATETLGRGAGDDWILAINAERIRHRQVEYVPDPAAVYHRHLHDMAEHLHPIARRLAAMNWTWYRTNRAFCIGDNPFCRWHAPTDQSVWGVGRGTEMTMPLSSSLTLCIRRMRGLDGGVHLCGRRLTRRFNHRQKMAAFSKVYAGEPETLNPQARFGFDAPLHERFVGRKLQWPGKLSF